MTECIEHNHPVNSSGYGSCRYMGKRVGRHVKAYCEAHNLDPNTFKRTDVVMHSCDNRRCINVEHLSLGTQSQNINDCSKKGRAPQFVDRHNAKLSQRDVSDIKARHIKGTGGNTSALAKEYGINKTYLLQISRGYHDHRTWPESTRTG